MFNMLVIVAISAAVATRGGNSLKIDHRVVARDVSFYVASITILAIAFIDGEIHWWEVKCAIGIQSTTHANERSCAEYYLACPILTTEMFSNQTQPRILNLPPAATLFVGISVASFSQYLVSVEITGYPYRDFAHVLLAGAHHGAGLRRICSLHEIQ